VTPQRIGGRVTPTKSGSTVSPKLRSLMTQTPNMPRTQVTICGAPNEIAIPKIAAIHHPQEIRFAIAIPPNTMTKMTATGVSQVRMLLWSAVAPVEKGDVCASTSAGMHSIMTTAMHRRIDLLSNLVLK
jgi:hypothetical protein